MNWIISLALKAVGAGKFGPVIVAALAVKANPNATTEAALLNAAHTLGDEEDPELAPVFDDLAPLGHDAIELINGPRTAALEIQASKDFVGAVNALVPAGKQVPRADLDALENSILKVIQDEKLI